MSSISLKLDADVIRRARKVAADRNTTVPRMVRDFLESVATMADADRPQTTQALRQSFAAHSRDMGPRSWSRDELHER